MIHANDGLGEKAPALYNMTFAMRVRSEASVQHTCSNSGLVAQASGCSIVRARFQGGDCQ